MIRTSLIRICVDEWLRDMGITMKYQTIFFNYHAFTRDETFYAATVQRFLSYIPI